MSKFSLRGATSFRRLLLAPLAAGAIALSTVAVAPAASAQPLPGVEQLSSDAQAQLDNFLGQSRNQAWDTRNGILAQVSNLNPQAASVLQPSLDAALEFIFPGLVGQKLAEERAAHEAQERAHAEEVAREQAASVEAGRQAEAARAAGAFDRGPCPADAKVCVDLDGRRAWLQGPGGEVTHVANSISSGKKGEETPRGTFSVVRKVEHDISYEFGNAPMPYSIYFTNNGHAFHEDSPAYESNGCIHLLHDDAVRFWNDLPVGAKVFIY